MFLCQNGHLGSRILKFHAQTFFRACVKFNPCVCACARFSCRTALCCNVSTTAASVQFVRPRCFPAAKGPTSSPGREIWCVSSFCVFCTLHFFPFFHFDPYSVCELDCDLTVFFSVAEGDAAGPVVRRPPLPPCSPRQGGGESRSSPQHDHANHRYAPYNRRGVVCVFAVCNCAIKHCCDRHRPFLCRFTGGANGHGFHRIISTSRQPHHSPSKGASWTVMIVRKFPVLLFSVHTVCIFCNSLQVCMFLIVFRHRAATADQRPTRKRITASVRAGRFCL